MKLYFSPDRYPKAREVCQVIADQLAKAGVRAELVSQEFVIFWGKEGVNGGKLPFDYVGRPAADADTVYDQYFRSGVSPRIQYKNPAKNIDWRARPDEKILYAEMKIR